jgi:pimeloyl-ACP methyl ester carboxylesterase
LPRSERVTVQLRRDVCFAKTRDGLRIAYAIHGDGPPLVYVRGLNSDVERWWAQG